MSQETTSSATMKSLVDLLYSVSKVEEYDPRELAQLSHMSIEEIELSLATHGLGSTTFRESAVLLKSLIEKFLDAQKAGPNNVNDQSRGTPKRFEKFTTFPGLPKELRRLIWKHALPGSQIIVFYRLRKHYGVGEESFDWLEIEGSSQHSLVHLMKVCFEAYEVVKSHYNAINPRAFGVKRSPLGSIILMDPNLDIVSIESRYAAYSFLQGSHISTQLGAQALANIQTLTLDYSSFCSITRTNNIHDLSLMDLKPFKSLKKIIVIEDEQHLVRPRNSSFFESRTWPVHLSPYILCHCAVCGVEENDIEPKWKAALEIHPDSTSLASVQVESALLMRDRKDRPLTVCDIIAQEIDRMALLENTQGMSESRVQRQQADTLHLY